MGADNEVAVGDLVEMLLSNSFASKDAMLEWGWLEIDLVEWPPQRLDWEIYRVEHLAFAKYIESTLKRHQHLFWTLPVQQNHQCRS